MIDDLFGPVPHHISHYLFECSSQHLMNVEEDTTRIRATLDCLARTRIDLDLHENGSIVHKQVLNSHSGTQLLPPLVYLYCVSHAFERRSK
jgi:hypothetical protein